MKRFAFLLAPLLAISFLTNCGGEKKYAITWMNEDGTLLSKTFVKENELPAYDKDLPTKEATEQFEYTFSGWSPTLKPATSDMIYTATYVSTVREYEITFDPNGGHWKDGATSPISKTFKYGAMPIYDSPKKASDNDYDYVFSGWSPKLSKVTSSKTYKANFAQLKKNDINLVVDFPSDANDKTIAFDYDGEVNNVDWGDGTSDTESSHEYSQSGQYIINIQGSISSFSLNGLLGLLSDGNAYVTVVKLNNGITSIGTSAFDSCSSLVSVVVPDGIDAINDYAFNNCSSLASINIPSSVNSIGESSFYNCSSLTSIDLSNITSIGDSAFNYCSSLTSIDIPILVSMGASAFRECSSLTSIIIPNTISEIASYAFSYCSSLTSVVFPDDTYSINDGAFSGCFSLTSIALKNVEYINFEAFYNCSSLVSIYIPKTTTYIDKLAFGNCSSLSSIVVEEGNTTYHSGGCNVIVETANNTLIAGCKTSKIPNDVVTIADYAFSGAKDLVSITFPNSLTTIGMSAFEDCSSLVSITIPSSVNEIATYAFCGCSSLSSIVVDANNENYDSRNNCNAIIDKADNSLIVGCGSSKIPNGIETIESYAFYRSNTLTSIVIPSSVNDITYNAFLSCKNLSSIVVEEGNKTYDSRNNCNAIINTADNELIVGCKDTKIPNTITSIGYCAFNNCSSLTSITIPNSVTSISEYAFEGTSLTSIFIPSSVTTIYWYAFNNCDKLAKIKCQANEQPDGWDESWKGNCNATIEWGCEPSTEMMYN